MDEAPELEHAQPDIPLLIQLAGVPHGSIELDEEESSGEVGGLSRSHKSSSTVTSIDDPEDDLEVALSSCWRGLTNMLSTKWVLVGRSVSITPLEMLGVTGGEG